MRLTDLEPRLLKWQDDRHWTEVQTVVEADGISFVCPQCLKDNKFHRPGVHSILCWEPNVPQSTSPTPGRWTLVGTAFSNLSLVGGSSSIKVEGGAHFFVKDGAIELCEDSRKCA